MRCNCLASTCNNRCQQGSGRLAGRTLSLALSIYRLDKSLITLATKFRDRQRKLQLFSHTYARDPDLDQFCFGAEKVPKDLRQAVPFFLWPGVAACPVLRDEPPALYCGSRLVVPAKRSRSPALLLNGESVDQSEFWTL